MTQKKKKIYIYIKSNNNRCNTTTFCCLYWSNRYDLWKGEREKNLLRLSTDEHMRRYL